MHLSVTKFGDDDAVVNVEVSSDLTLRDLKAVIEAESTFGINATDMLLYHDGKILQNDDQTLEQCQVKDYDLITCRLRRAPSAVSSEPTTATGLASALTDHIRQLFNELRQNPRALENFRTRDPSLAAMVERNDIQGFIRAISSSRGQTRPSILDEQDLLDPRIQQRIEAEINMENVRDNMEHAYEFAPEFFGNVTMLYINCKVNGHPVKAFVDSGAQMTIMSRACAERCGIMRLIDRRFAGVARGVGTQEIIGRIHLAQLEVEKQFFAISLSVLADQTMDMLIGLDMLRRHRCLIDLEKNVLQIENVVQTAFLPESELPDFARLSSPTSPGRLCVASPQSPFAPQSATPSRQPTSPDTASSPYPPGDIQKIVKQGFTREQAIEELKLFNGDVKKALVSLMTKSLNNSKKK